MTRRKHKRVSTTNSVAINLTEPQAAPSDPGCIEIGSPEATAFFRRKLAVLEAEHARGQYEGSYGPVRIVNSDLNDLLYTLLRENWSGWIAHNEGRNAEAKKHFQAFRVAQRAVFNSRRWTAEEKKAAWRATD